MNPKQSDILIPPTSVGHPDLIRDTISFWEGRYGRPVSPEEAREMVANLVGYFSLLAEWDSVSRIGSDRLQD